VNVIQLVTQAA